MEDSKVAPAMDQPTGPARASNALPAVIPPPPAARAPPPSQARAALVAAAPERVEIAAQMCIRDRYNDAYTLMNDKGVQLYIERCRALDLISFVENLVNSIANRPKSFDAEFAEISVQRKNFKMCIRDSIAAHCGPRPQLPKGLGGLIHQLHCVGQKQRAFAKSLGIHDGGHCLAGAGGMIEQSDGLKIAAHLFQSGQSLLLVLLQFQLGAVQGFSPLRGKIVLNFLEAGMLAQEYP